MRSSILIPSFRRPALLERCLRALAAQTVAPDEALVAWQGDDTSTRDRVMELASLLPINVALVHVPEPGIVPAENAMLKRATGDVILLIDDDAIAPDDWLERHLAHYADDTVGAVGGQALCFDAQGTPLPTRDDEPIGRLTWYGRFIGNMHDHPASWRHRPPCDVDHLVGYNMSLRREAFDQFDASLRRYWQLFEADACLQVQGRGYRVVFDPAIVVEHRVAYTASVYSPGRDGDPIVKFGNAAYNGAFILAKHTSSAFLCWVRWLYLVMVGTSSAPGPLLLPLTIKRNGRVRRELAIARLVLQCKRDGWRDGRLTANQATGQNHLARRQAKPPTEAPDPALTEERR